MKKHLCILCALLVSAGALASCGGNNQSSSTSSGSSSSSSSSSTSGSAATTSASSTGEPAKAEHYKYRMVMHNFGPWGENPEMIARWNQEYNAEFELVYVETAKAGEQVNLMVAANDIPDVFQMIDQQKYFTDGIIGGWDEGFFRENAPNLSAYYDETDKSVWNIAKFDGEKMYSIPNFRKYDTVAPPVIWRDDWLKAVGITEIPKTLTQAEEAFYKIAQNDPDGNGKADTYGLSDTGMRSIYGAFGSMRNKWILGEDGTVTYGDVKPEMKEALALLNKWYKDGVLDPEFITGENEGGYWAITHKFINNRIGYTNMGSFYHWLPDMTGEAGGSAVGEITKEWKNSGNPGSYAVGYAPEGPNGKKGTDQGDPRKLRTTFSTPLVKDTARFGRLLQIIDDMNATSVDKSIEVNRGTMGKYVEKTTEFRGIDSVKYIGEAASAPSLLPFLSEIGSANTFAFIEEGGTLDYQEVMYSQQFAWYEDALKDRNFGYTSAIFAAPASRVKYDAELKKILDTGYTSIITGEKPLDYFDEMVKAWNQNGGEVLTKEANEIYAREQGK